MHEIVLKLRLPLILFLNIVITALSFTTALGLRFDFDLVEMSSFHGLSLAFLNLITLRLASYIYFELNQGYWRYTSLNDLKDIIKAHAFSTAFFAASIYAFQTPYPRSCIIMEFILSVFLAGGSRLFVRSLSEYFVGRERMLAGHEAQETVILGAGDSGHLLIKLISNSPHIPYVPICILDDTERLKGTTVNGIKVKGEISLLESVLVANPKVSAVISAIPSLSQARIEEIKEICDSYSVTFKKLQSFEDIAVLNAGSGAHVASIESLLDKETVIEHEKEIANAIKGTKVLITGAGGSIGSEIVRQVLGFKPSMLILLDNSEFNLYKMVNELRNEETCCKFVVCSIKDTKRLSLIFEEYKPDFVYHAAAFKHVPLMEENCYEAFVNNVLGTRNVYELSAKNNVKKFVFISTDKAVDPTSVMGCSKKIAELMLQFYANKDGNRTAVSAVRFGNVINSTGSVIPLFKEQIAKGGPLTVTHPDMDRFFMSIKEAVRLVLTAGTLGEDGEIYVLDMGKKLKIVDVAKKMLALYGRRDIEIVFTGLRPGEKMTEELLTDYEYSTPTRFRKVNKLISRLQSDETVIEWITELEKSLSGMEDSDVGSHMKRFIQEIESSYKFAAKRLVNQ